MSIIENEFWYGWENKFEDNYNDYITPEDKKVKKFIQSEAIAPGASDFGSAKKAWDMVYWGIEYVLSAKWKTPRETLESGKGDCEDVTFLLASILPHLGVNNFKVEAGVATNGESEMFHTWLKVDGNVVDPTAEPCCIDNLIYEPEVSFDVNIKGE